MSSPTYSGPKKNVNCPTQRGTTEALLFRADGAAALLLHRAVHCHGGGRGATGEENMASTGRQAWLIDYKGAVAEETKHPLAFSRRDLAVGPVAGDVRGVTLKTRTAAITRSHHSMPGVLLPLPPPSFVGDTRSACQISPATSPSKGLGTLRRGKTRCSTARCLSSFTRRRMDEDSVGTINLLLLCGRLHRRAALTFLFLYFGYFYFATDTARHGTARRRELRVGQQFYPHHENNQRVGGGCPQGAKSHHRNACANKYLQLHNAPKCRYLAAEHLDLLHLPEAAEQTHQIRLDVY